MLSYVFKVILRVFGTFSDKVVQTWFVFRVTWHTKLFGIYYCVEMVRIKIIVICLKISAKLRFYGFQSFFSTFSHYVVQTWFVWQENWHTTLFYIHNCVEIVRIENYCHILEITCKVTYLMFLKRFWHFLA